MKRIALWLTLLFIAGCGDGKNPTRPIVPVPFQYPAPNSPQNAVLIYKYAWERKDTVQTQSILNDVYIGKSTDLTDVIPIMLAFSKSDEVRIVANMARDSTLYYVSVDLGPSSSWIRLRYESDPLGWASIQIPHASVTIQQGVEIYTADAPSYMEFTLKPTPPTAGSGYDTTWTIVRWTETRISL